MKQPLLLILALVTVSVWAQDKCKPFGWALYDGQSTVIGAPTGGGNATPVQVTTFADFKAQAESSGAKVIYVMNDMGTGYGLQLGDFVRIASDKTIIGYKPGITIRASMMMIGVQNIILRNFAVRGPDESNSLQYWDNFHIEGSKRIWIDHCQSMNGEDGNFDITKSSDNVTLTWCIFTYSKDGGHNLSNLIGGSDTEGSENKLNTTFAYCWFKDIDERQPRTRFGKVHLINCYFSALGGLTNSSATSAGYLSSVRVENCHYEKINTPWKIKGDVLQARIDVIDCIFTDCYNMKKGTSDSVGTVPKFIPPYEYKSFMVPASEVKALVTNADCGAGPTMDSPTQCGCGTPTAPTLVLSTGTATQTVSSGIAIASIVYTWGGTATDVTVSGLPAGLTATKNTSAKTVIIAGTPTATGTFTVTTVQPSGTAAVLTGTITVSSSVASVQLHTGWNYIGCPLSGSTDVAKALSSVWSHVLVVKNYDSFYDKSVSTTLNSLAKVDWGVGYMVKVDAACLLTW